MTKKAIVVGISSGIGSAIAQALLADNIDVLGSYRSEGAIGDHLKSVSQLMDLKHNKDILRFIDVVKNKRFQWDQLIICSGTMEPIGRFESIDIDQWIDNIHINLTAQLRLLHGLLPLRNQLSSANVSVLTLAGGGVNGAPTHYSAYTVAKIGMIKMTELLAAEMPDINFVNLGPGWVNTPIHQQTINAAEQAGQAYDHTMQRLANNEFVPMEQVVECALTLLNGESAIYSGRNFSAANDRLTEKQTRDALIANPDMYKLRRHHNEW